MNQLRIVLGRHVIRQGDVSPDPLTYRPSDRPTHLPDASRASGQTPPSDLPEGYD